MTETADVIVIGAGVIGLAVGRALAQASREVIIAEKNAAFGEETSARNSEVIHAGIQYRPGGVRARLAVKGRDALYAFCANHNVEHKRCGKLLVANGDEELARLSLLKKNAEANGVDDLSIVDAAEAAVMEPNIKCDAAIVSPSSGIVDSHGLMLALLGDFENAGGALALSTPVETGKVVEGGIELSFGGAEAMTLKARTVVNCAGLWADRVARSIEGVPRETIPALRYARGQYFTYSGAAPFERLIYPIAETGQSGRSLHARSWRAGEARTGHHLCGRQSGLQRR